MPGGCDGFLRDHELKLMMAVDSCQPAQPGGDGGRGLEMFPADFGRGNTKAQAAFDLQQQLHQRQGVESECEEVAVGLEGLLGFHDVMRVQDFDDVIGGHAGSRPGFSTSRCRQPRQARE